MWLAGAAGIWMFYVQHQFEYAYWVHSSDWDYTQAALQGASFYRLPRILQWFTGNIGFHHIHHLSPRIPNYFLEKCFKENPAFKPPFTIGCTLRVKNVLIASVGRASPAHGWVSRAANARRIICLVWIERQLNRRQPAVFFIPLMQFIAFR